MLKRSEVQTDERIHSDTRQSRRLRAISAFSLVRGRSPRAMHGRNQCGPAVQCRVGHAADLPRSDRQGALGGNDCQRSGLAVSGLRCDHRYWQSAAGLHRNGAVTPTVGCISVTRYAAYDFCWRSRDRCGSVYRSMDRGVGGRHRVGTGRDRRESADCVALPRSEDRPAQCRPCVVAGRTCGWWTAGRGNVQLAPGMADEIGCGVSSRHRVDWRCAPA